MRKLPSDMELLQKSCGTRVIYNGSLKISKIEEDLPITISLTGETYSVKEKLKELGYKWDRDIRAWKKYLLLENVEQEIVILKEIKKIKMSGRPPKKSEYNNWLAAHRGCEQK